MIGRAVDAVILLRLDARRGQWLSVHELADYLRVRVDLVAERIDAIAQDNGLRVQRAGGWTSKVMSPPAHAGDLECA